MKPLFAVVLFVAGLFLIYTGYRRADSVLGETKAVIADVRNSIDGKYRTTTPVMYYAGGAACLIVAGLLLIRRK